MEDNKNREQQAGQSGEQNPTLNSPGSRVADYGNPTGGSAAGEQQEEGQGRKNTENIPTGNSDTIGIP
ncbi:MAG TPA: hypothetical protein VER36_00520 [Flavisolibacter sp.]|nr:hypothetical protein [Flavisolibacter sp.]